MLTLELPREPVGRETEIFEPTGQIVANGYAYARRGDLDKARERYLAALEQEPLNVDALMLLGLLLSEGPESDTAEALLRCYDDLVPGNPIALRNLGLIAQRRGDDMAAAEYLERVVAIQPDSPGNHYALGVSYRRLGRAAAAETAFKRAAALEPPVH